MLHPNCTAPSAQWARLAALDPPAVTKQELQETSYASFLQVFFTSVNLHVWFFTLKICAPVTVAVGKRSRQF